MFKSKIYIAAIIMVFILLGAIGVMTKLYLDKRDEVQRLSDELDSYVTENNRLKKQIAEERSSSEAIRETNVTVDNHTEEVLMNVDKIKTTEAVTALDPVDVGNLLCQENLATPEACATINFK